MNLWKNKSGLLINLNVQLLDVSGEPNEAGLYNAKIYDPDTKETRWIWLTLEQWSDIVGVGMRNVINK